MSYYKDNKITIDQKNITVKGAILPIVGNIIFDADELSKIEVVDLSLLSRLTLVGTNNLKTWYGVDLKRPLRKKAIRLTTTDPVGPFKEFVFTPSDIEHSMRVLKQNFPNSFS